MSLNYRPEIDGLRALAVLPVILFHAGFPAFSGGFVGVDVFFVISGYLITSIIVKDVAAGAFSFADFYERRTRRILPALFLVMLCCVPFALMWMTPTDLRVFSTSLVWVSLFASNILFARQSGYFDTASEMKPLLHTWSLAVEEQFYILFPIAVLLLWRFGRKRLVWSLALVAVLSLALSEYASRTTPSLNFYLLPTRAWELMAGALASFAVLRPDRLRDEVLSVAGLAAIVLAVFLYDETIRFPSLHALLPVLGTCAIILCAREGTLVCALLSMRPVVGLGLLSYSAYLWHQPLFAFARIRSLTHPDGSVMLALAACSVLLAYVTWRFVETPLRRRGAWPLPNRRRVFVALGVTATLFIVAGRVGHFMKGFPERFTPLPLASSGEFVIARIDNGYCFYTVNDMTDLPLGERGLACTLGDQSATARKALLFGDSLAAHWEPFWDTLGKNFGLTVRSVTTNWCFPAYGESFTADRLTATRAFRQCQHNRRYLRDHAAEHDVVILAGLWDMIENRHFSGDVIAVIEDLLKRTTAQVIVMPSPRAVTRNSVETSVFTGRVRLVPDETTQKRIDAFEAWIRAMAQKEKRLTFLEAPLLFGDHHGSGGALTSGGLPYSLDGTHISIYGSRASAAHALSDRQARALLDEVLGPSR